MLVLGSSASLSFEVHCDPFGCTNLQVTGRVVGCQSSDADAAATTLKYKSPTDLFRLFAPGASLSMSLFVIRNVVQTRNPVGVGSAMTITCHVNTS